MFDPHRLSEKELLDRLAHGHYRVLVLGESGTGKTTLILRLMAELSKRGRDSVCLNCDPGLPAFGPPGTLALARQKNHDWSIMALEPLCTLDAGRFRLPLLLAASHLLTQFPHDQTATLFLDTPGLVRGLTAAELVQGLASVARIDLCLVLVRPDHPLPLARELAALPARVISLTASPQAHALSKQRRSEQRSERWQAFMAKARSHRLNTQDLTLLGTPPPLDHPESWRGRQVALLNQGHLESMGEVEEATEKAITVRVAGRPGPANQLLVRNAVHREGRMHTAPTANSSHKTNGNGVNEVRAELGSLTSVAKVPQVAVRVGYTVASLVNGVAGDPLLQLRMLHQPRSLLFDMGDSGRMPLRSAHQVTDVFITHAHADHIGGFLWLVRSRIGYFAPCRVFGPPGLHQHVQGMVNGILWDRVEDRAPRFIVHEWQGDHLERWQVVAGEPESLPLEPVAIHNGVIHREAGFIVRACELDHGIPVMAYAYEPRYQLKVRRNQLEALGLKPGPWLQTLKHAYLHDRFDEKIDFADGRSFTVEELASTLLMEQPGEKLVYATDFSTSEDNINKLGTFAHGAHTLFCESSFMVADQDQAERTQHLTTEACARIANKAEVRQLVAFHFSHRYEKHHDRVYEELQRFTLRLRVPRKEEQPDDQGFPDATPVSLTG